MTWHVMSCVPNQNTYYSDEEYARIKELAKERDVSFSLIVREAVQEQYDL